MPLFALLPHYGHFVPRQGCAPIHRSHSKCRSFHGVESVTRALYGLSIIRALRIPRDSFFTTSIGTERQSSDEDTNGELAQSNGNHTNDCRDTHVLCWFDRVLSIPSHQRDYPMILLSVPLMGFSPGNRDDCRRSIPLLSRTEE